MPRAYIAMIFVEAHEAPRAFENQDGGEAANAVAWNVRPQRAVAGEHRLAASTVALVSRLRRSFRARRRTQLVTQLRASRLLDERLLERGGCDLAVLALNGPFTNWSISFLGMDYNAVEGSAAAFGLLGIQAPRAACYALNTKLMTGPGRHHGARNQASPARLQGIVSPISDHPRTVCPIYLAFSRNKVESSIVIKATKQV